MDYNRAKSSKKIAIVSKDLLYTMGASVVSTGILQLVIYPFLANSLDSYEYGTLLTIMGMINIVVLSLGNSLGSTRLINNICYKNEGIVGDFNILLLFPIIVSVFTILIYGKTSNLIISVAEVIPVLLFVFLTIIRTYLSYSYRIYLSLKKYFFSYLILGVGYLFGVFLIINLYYWAWVFVLAEFLSLCYELTNSQFVKEPFKLTKFFKKTSILYLFLIISGLLGDTATYIDRLIIYPYLGSNSVSIYQVSSFLGKTLYFLVGPISSLLLSYIASGATSFNLKNLLQINIIIVGLGCLFAVFIAILGPFVTNIFYPSLAEQAKPFILIANLGVILNIMNTVNAVIVLKFAPGYWQLIFGISKLALYIILALLLMGNFGLMGFCYAVLITNILILVLSISVASKYVCSVDVKE